MKRSTFFFCVVLAFCASTYSQLTLNANFSAGVTEGRSDGLFPQFNLTEKY